ncbi:MAG: TIGR03086 family protein [Candidatus Dormibacteraeota bacterium]|nr:TIGR03086 family protein [Candidatus Dormibacteraeota bacterium]MBV9526602.1 TIGR03086 family protein [Candidatus Dormibacteraeota bacterium]
MADQEQAIALLSRSLDQAGAAVGGVREDQLELPTPCASWNVRMLVNHVLYDLQQFAKMVKGEQWKPGSIDVPYEEWTATFSSGSAELLSAWRDHAGDASAAQRPPTQQIAEFAVHGWDVARATGQHIDFDDDAATVALEWARSMLKPEYRGSEESGKVFGPEVQIAGDAAAIDRLAAFFGRDPSWSP